MAVDVAALTMLDEKPIEIMIMASATMAAPLGCILPSTSPSHQTTAMSLNKGC
jgi:hypothetical protein